MLFFYLVQQYVGKEARTSDIEVKNTTLSVELHVGENRSMLSELNAFLSQTLFMWKFLLLHICQYYLHFLRSVQH